MMDPKLAELLNRKIQEHINQHLGVLSDGVAKDYAHYKELCGAIRGLQTAQMEVNDLVRKLKDVDDD
jgi:tryptophan 2,3-dioxygenase